MASKKASIKNNYIFNLIYTLLNTALPLLTAPYLARTIGVEGTGTYAYFYSVAYFFFLFAKLGLTNYGTREISTAGSPEKLSKTFSEIYTQQFFVSLLVNVVYGGYCFSVARSGQNYIYPLILWIVVLGSMLDIDWLYSGLENFKLISIRNIIVKITTVALIFIFVKKPQDLWLYTVLMAFGMLFGHISMWINVRKYVRFIKPAFRDVIKHLKPNAVLAVPILAMSVYRYMDKIMLGSMSGMIDTGLYDNAEKIVYALCGFINSLGTVMMPRMSSLMVKNEKEKSSLYISYSIQFILCLMFGMAFGLLLTAKDLVIIIFGREFAGSGPLLAALAFTLPAIGWSSVIRTHYIVPAKHDYIFIYTVSFGAVINIIVNWFCIPRLGSIGAVVGTICAEYGVVLMQFLLIRKEIDYWNLIRHSLFAPVCGGLMYFGVKLLVPELNNAAETMVLQIIAGILLYFAFVAAYYYIFEKEFFLRIAKQLRH